MLDRVRGIITALVTPFRPDDSVDEEGLRVLLERQIKNGIHGVAVVAGSGEYVNLSDDERSRIVSLSVEQVAGRVPVIVGVLSPNTRDAVAWGKKAASLGADALLVLSPYYNKPSVPGIVGHYRAIAEAAGLPIIVYNNPPRTGIDLTACYAQLAEIPEIIGIKECNRDLAVLSQTISALGTRWSTILGGEDDLLYPSLVLGVRGAILTTSNIVPSRWVAMYDAFTGGDHETARAIHYELLPLINAVYTLNHPALVKKALTTLGLPAGRTRAPLADPLPEQVKRIEELIAAMRLAE